MSAFFFEAVSQFGKEMKPSAEDPTSRFDHLLMLKPQNMAIKVHNEVSDSSRQGSWLSGQILSEAACFTRSWPNVTSLLCVYCGIGSILSYGKS